MKHFHPIKLFNYIFFSNFYMKNNVPPLKSEVHTRIIIEIVNIFKFEKYSCEMFLFKIFELNRSCTIVGNNLFCLLIYLALRTHHVCVKTKNKINIRHIYINIRQITTKYKACVIIRIMCYTFLLFFTKDEDAKRYNGQIQSTAITRKTHSVDDNYHYYSHFL